MKYIAYSLATHQPRGMGDTPQDAIDVMVRAIPRRWVEIIEFDNPDDAHRVYARDDTLPRARLNDRCRTVFRGEGGGTNPLPPVGYHKALRFHKELYPSHDGGETDG